MQLIKALSLFFVLSSVVGCIQQQQRQETFIPLPNIYSRGSESNKLSYGTVQSVVKKGASGDEIIGKLGSPNIITTDSAGNESWVYDKVSQETEVAANSSQAVIVKSSKTLTVIIKFDNKKRVREFATHSSSF